MPTELLDQPQKTRPGEELDASKLETYLQHTLPELSGDMEITQFPKGYSNLTYLLRVGEQELVLRRPPFGAKIKTAHDMGREYRILSHLIAVYPKVPRPLAYCEDESVLGAPFYIMERVKGIILRAKPPEGLELTPALMRQISEHFIDNLAQIHGVDYVAAGLGDLGKPEGYVTRQVEGWIKRYLNARTDDIPEMQRIASWLVEHKPAEAGGCLIHNDYKYDNLVLNPQDVSQIKAVLDWEMATIGDPLMDLGSTLGYWVDPDDPEDWQKQSFGMTTWPGNLNREQLLERYVHKSGRTVSNAVFYYAYALFKIAVIVQQIYARYKQGLTKDARFASLINLVRSGSKTACLAIEKKRITRLALN
ncbi:MAG: phosphotransferase family protein [Verrucomicrobia bacterium]|nr:phosphotransferase family protein [Verrucomicrobiota bacterium]